MISPVYSIAHDMAGATNVEYIPYHICSSQTTVHKVYHNEKYPSYLLLPVIPQMVSLTVRP